MFSKFYMQKIQGKGGNMSDGKERLLSDDIADSEELVEKMPNLSLKSIHQSQLKQDMVKKMSIPHSFRSIHENPSYQRKSGRLGFINQPFVQLRGMFPSVKSPQRSSNGELNQNFIFTTCHQGLSMQRNSTEPEHPSSPKNKSCRKVLNDFNLSQYFFNGGHRHTHHHCVFLIPRNN